MGIDLIMETPPLKCKKKSRFLPPFSYILIGAFIYFFNRLFLSNAIGIMFLMPV